MNTLRFWNSPGLPDVNGAAEYIRFGVKLLSQSPLINNSLCQAAMDRFNDLCQDGNQVTHGGEIYVGDGMVMFSADPTDIANNY